MKVWNWHSSSVVSFWNFYPSLHATHTKTHLCVVTHKTLQDEAGVGGCLGTAGTILHDWRWAVLPPSRLYVLQGGLAQQEWRVPELLHRLLKYLEPKLTQVYKNVRERIGRSVLSSAALGAFFSLHYIWVIEYLNNYTEVVTADVCVNIGHR